MYDLLYHVGENLDWIREHWGDLLAARYPGTRRPWHSIFLTPEMRRQTDELVAAERRDRATPRAAHLGQQWLAPTPLTGRGESASPVVDAVLSVILDAEAAILDLEDLVRDELGYSRTCSRCRHEADGHSGAEGCGLCACPAYRLKRRAVDEGAEGYTVITPARVLSDPQHPWRREYVAPEREWEQTRAPEGSVHWACVWLDSAQTAIRDHPLLAEQVAAETWRVRRMMMREVGDIQDGMMLRVACIGCDGRTEDRPEGGEFTLRLRTSPALVIVCLNEACDPPSSLCGTWIGNRPAWPQHEWDWLAEWMRARDAARASAAVAA